MELSSGVAPCTGLLGYSSGPHECIEPPASFADVKQQDNGEYCKLQDDEIPAETEVLTSKYQVQEMKMKKHREKRILKLFISHILDDSKIKLSSEKENYFCMGQMIFKKVYVRGIITSVNLIKNGTHTFSVDDGTGTLDCFLFKNTPLEELRSKTLELIEDNTQLLQRESNPMHRVKHRT
uniref:OB domain-containing protein n=1 Tax=Photinus pyralis TaxID=7054 RepID=A0A1Y1M1I8_PHOPY